MICFAPQRLFGEDFPLLQTGFVSVTELVSAMSDTLHLKPVVGNNVDWIVMDMQDCDDAQSGVYVQMSEINISPITSLGVKSGRLGKKST